jgi:preprotein translocase subunit YajC
MESLGGLLFPLFLLLLFVPIFLSGRKQRRQVQEAQQLQGSLQVGDVVTTTSGLRGTVVDVQYEETIDLEIADDVVTTWLRAAIRDRVVDASADTPADTTADTADDVPALADDRPADDRPADDATPAGPRTDGAARPAESPSDANGTPRP